MNPETFGFEPDDNGDIQFVTVSTDFVIHNFEEYQLFFAELVQIAYNNQGVMPIYRPNETGS